MQHVRRGHAGSETTHHRRGRLARRCLTLQIACSYPILVDREVDGRTQKVGFLHVIEQSRSRTVTDRNPPLTGVVSGPLRASLVRRMLSRVLAGSGSPCV